MPKEKPRDDRPIDDIEDDLDGDILMPDDQPEEQVEEREEDEFSEDDPVSRRDFFTLSLPNTEKLEDGKDHPGYRKLVLDIKSFPPEDSIECVVLYRAYPRYESVPYKEGRGLAPWEKMLGYSWNGKFPTPNRKGEYFDSCLAADGVPFAICSVDTKYSDSGEVLETPLSTESRTITNKEFPYLGKTEILCRGECPNGRWANTLTSKDRKSLKIKSRRQAPACDKYIKLWAWHLEYGVLFQSFWKRTSYMSAYNFLASFSRGGPTTRRDSWHSMVARITVSHEGEYAIPMIRNTGVPTDKALMKQVIRWFKDRKEDFVKNDALHLEELKKQAEEFGDK